MVELNPRIKEALVKINFVERYEKLSNTYNEKKTPSDKRLIYIDGEEVMETIQDLGYLSEFDEKEKFYKFKEERKEEFTFGFHIVLYSGMVDLVWIVKEKNDLILGAPWGTYSRRLIDPSYKIKKPIFGTYDDLQEILEIAFEMYEDFKKAFLGALE